MDETDLDLVHRRLTRIETALKQLADTIAGWPPDGAGAGDGLLRAAPPAAAPPDAGSLAEPPGAGDTTAVPRGVACVACGVLYDDQRRFCSRCGRRLDPAALL